MLDIWLPNRPAEEAKRKSTHRDAKKQPLKCKEAPLKLHIYTVLVYIYAILGNSIAFNC